MADSKEFLGREYDGGQLVVRVTKRPTVIALDMEWQTEGTADESRQRRVDLPLSVPVGDAYGLGHDIASAAGWSAHEATAQLRSYLNETEATARARRLELDRVRDILSDHRTAVDILGAEVEDLLAHNKAGSDSCFSLAEEGVKLNDEHEKVVAERDALKARLAEAESRRSSCCGTPEFISAVNRRIDVITRHVDSLGNTVQAAAKENDRLREELARVTAERDALRAAKPTADREALAALVHERIADLRTNRFLWSDVTDDEREPYRKLVDEIAERASKPTVDVAAQQPESSQQSPATTHHCRSCSEPAEFPHMFCPKCWRAYKQPAVEVGT